MTVLRWYVGVPIGTNPLILLDIASVLLLAWGIITMLLLGLQFFFGGYIEAPQTTEAFSVAAYMTSVFFAIFLLAAFIIQRNGYAALYRFEEKEVYCENLRTSPRPLEASFSPRWKGYAIENVQDSIRSVVKVIRWEDVSSVYPIESMNVLLLKTKRSTLRVYCPNNDTFDKALKTAEERIKNLPKKG